jgi:hypothetical protein
MHLTTSGIRITCGLPVQACNNRITSHHVQPHRTTSHHITPHLITPHHIKSHSITCNAACRMSACCCCCWLRSSRMSAAVCGRGGRKDTSTPVARRPSPGVCQGGTRADGHACALSLRTGPCPPLRAHATRVYARVRASPASGWPHLRPLARAPAQAAACAAPWPAAPAAGPALRSRSRPVPHAACQRQHIHTHTHDTTRTSTHGARGVCGCRCEGRSDLARAAVPCLQHAGGTPARLRGTVASRK